MAINAQRKVLLAVAGVACAAVAADQILLGGIGGTPSGAEAAVSDVAVAAAAPPPAPVPTVADTAALPSDAPAPEPGPNLGQRLREAEAALDPDTPDAFTPRGRWARETADDGQAAAPGPTPVDLPDPDTFAARNPLQGVMFVGLEPRAVVDGRPMRVGDTRDGFTLEAIGDRWVVWANAATRFRVRLDPGR